MKTPIKLIALLAAVLMIFSAVACAGKPAATAPAAEAPAAEAPAVAEAPVDDTVYELALTTHNAESNGTVQVLLAMADKIREESNGRLNITVYAGSTLANANDALTTTGAGAADMCWVTVSQNASSLPISTFSTVPTLKYTNTYQSTYMMVKTIEKFPEIANEFAAQNVKLVAVHGCAPAWILSDGMDLSTPEAFNGELIMSANPNYITMLEGMGASVMSDLATQIYDSMSKGVYHALLVDFQAACAFKIPEVIDRAYDYNFGSVISYVAINLDKYNALPADLQQLLDSHFEDFSMAFAERLNADISKDIAAHTEYNYEILETSPEVAAKLDQIAQEKIIPNYVSQCEAAGADGQAILDYAGQMVEEAKGLYGAEYDWVQ